jgi:hypothetical protein
MSQLILILVIRLAVTFVGSPEAAVEAARHPGVGIEPELMELVRLRQETLEAMAAKESNAPNGALVDSGNSSCAVQLSNSNPPNGGFTSAAPDRRPGGHAKEGWVSDIAR